MPTTPRDIALLVLAGVIVVIVAVCATVMAIRFDTEAAALAAFGVLTSTVGLAGVALGRLGGPPQTPPPETP